MTSMDNDVDGLPRLTVISFSAPIFRIINVEKFTNECFLDTSGAIFRTGSCSGSENISKVKSLKYNLEDLAVCPVDYCENDGRCYIEENVQKCKCRSRFYGHRCQKLRTLENGNFNLRLLKINFVFQFVMTRALISFSSLMVLSEWEEETIH